MPDRQPARYRSVEGLIAGLAWEQVCERAETELSPTAHYVFECLQDRGSTTDEALVLRTGFRPTEIARLRSEVAEWVRNQYIEP